MYNWTSPNSSIYPPLTNKVNGSTSTFANTGRCVKFTFNRGMNTVQLV